MAVYGPSRQSIEVFRKWPRSLDQRSSGTGTLTGGRFLWSVVTGTAHHWSCVLLKKQVRTIMPKQLDVLSVMNPSQKAPIEDLGVDALKASSEKAECLVKVPKRARGLGRTFLRHKTWWIAYFH